MSDEEPTPDEAQVRRLLADARVTEPMPADVADRLDRVLADLAAPPAAPPRPGDELAARRRRRRTAGAVLVAAAAVVVVGVGISRIDDLTMSGADSGSSNSVAGGDYAERDAGGSAAPSAAPVELTSAGFDRQVRRLVGSTSTLSVPQELPDAASDSLLAGEGCPDDGWGTGTRIAVVYDGSAGVLVVRPPAGGTSAVDLFLCGASTPTRSTEVPAG